MKTARHLIALAAILFAGAAFAAEGTPGSKEVTLKGALLCGKCTLKETKACQNVLKVTEGDKSTLYYLVDNSTSKDKHPDVCMSPKENVTVTGTVETKDGKNELTATKIDIPVSK